MISAFPDPYPDELLYSVCVRYCDRLQYRGKRCGLEDLFGRIMTYLEWDIPSHLGELVRRLPVGHLYSIRRLIQEHTVVPFYRAFMPRQRVERLLSKMESRRGGLSAVQAGLGKMWGQSRRLRYCPQCANDDVRVFGESYWHRLHQLPGVEVCATHRVFLENSDVSKVDCSIRNRLISAKRGICLDYPRTCDPAIPAHYHFLRVAEDARWIMAQSDYLAEPIMTLTRYRMLLADRQLATYTGSKIRHQQIVEGFRLIYPEEFLRIVGCELLIHQRYSWISSLLRPRAATVGMVRQPIQHLLLIQFLGHTAESFFQVPLDRRPFGDAPWPCLNPVCSYYRQPVIQRCSTVYARTNGGRPRGTFACQCGFTYVRVGPDRKTEDRFRWSWIETRGPQWDERFRKIWMDRTQLYCGVMRQFGIGQQTLYKEAQRLGLPPSRRRPQSGLGEVVVHKPRLLKRSSSAILKDRDAYLNLRRESPGASAWELRQVASALCQRIYVHDREWINENAPWPRRKVLFGPRPKVEMRRSRLDRRMVGQIEEAVRVLKNKPGRPVQITRTQIGQVFRWRPAQLTRSKLARFPLARRALTRCIETWEEYAIRRITWAVQALHDEGTSLCRSNLIPKAGLDWPTAMRHPQVRKAIDAAVEEREIRHRPRPNRAA